MLFFLETEKTNGNNFVQKQAQPEAQASTSVETTSKQASSGSPSQIKINLKFNKGGTLKTVTDQTSSSEQPATSTAPKTTTTVKKSRFSSNVSNVIQEQNRFKEQQQQQQKAASVPVKSAPGKSDICNEDMEIEENGNESAQCDIVYHIDKWPDALKNYCARVYKQYASSSQVSEDQVTKYLQKRITDAFKLRPDLNNGWESEKIPEIYDIKQVS